MNNKGKRRSRFDARLEVYYDELRQLFMDLYHDEEAFEYFLDMLRKNFRERKKTLKDVDARRAAHPYMHHSNRMMGMMLYTENFGGSLNGVTEKLEYFKECGVKYVHLMPLLGAPEDSARSDGGYAGSDFRKVKPELGTMEDLEKLTSACHRRGIRVSRDFGM